MPSQMSPQVQAKKQAPAQATVKPVAPATVAVEDAFEDFEEDAQAEASAAATKAATASFEVFSTENIEPPPVARRVGEEAPKYPFEALDKVGKWFLAGPLTGADGKPDKEAKQRMSSAVYKKHKKGHKFRLIKIDERFAKDIKRPDLVGWYGVWRIE